MIVIFKFVKLHVVVILQMKLQLFSVVWTMSVEDVLQLLTNIKSQISSKENDQIYI